MNDNVISKIKEHLTENQLKMFRATCFGHFLDLKELKFQGQLVHCLLLREVSHHASDQIWFSIGGYRMRFSVGEFGIITGLKCVDDFDRSSIANYEKNSLIENYFGDTAKVKKEALEECFFSGKFECDEDAVKIAMLYFLTMFLFTSPKDKFVIKKYLDIVDAGLYNEYCWGSDLFSLTLESVKGKLLRVRKQGIDYCYYRLNGFPLALQVWFYECCEYCVNVLAFHLGSSIPCILNWHTNVIPSFKKLNSQILNLSLFQVNIFRFLLFLVCIFQIFIFLICLLYFL